MRTNLFNMRVKVKYKDIIHRTPKATYFLLKNEKMQWIPNKCFCYGKQGAYLVMNKEFCIKKRE